MDDEACLDLHDFGNQVAGAFNRERRLPTLEPSAVANHGHDAVGVETVPSVDVG